MVRQWLVLMTIPNPPRKIDAATIEAKLRERGIEVHRRTIQRDLVELATVFPIVADERAKPYGWRWANASFLLGGEDHANALGFHRPPFNDRSLPRMKVEASLRIHQESGPAQRDSEQRERPTITRSFEDAESLMAFVLRHAGGVEVLAPHTLRAELVRRAREVLHLHQRCE